MTLPDVPAAAAAPGYRGLRSAAAAAVWYLLGVLGLMLDSHLPAVGHDRATLLLSGAALCFGLWVYWRHGGARVSAVGVYNLAFALFVGFAGLHLLFWGKTETAVVVALAWCYFGHITTWMLFWAKEPPRPPPSPPGSVDPRLLKRITWVGLPMILANGLSYVVVKDVAPVELRGLVYNLALAVGFVGVVLVAIGLLSDRRRSPLLACVLGAGGLLLATVTSTSYGRLNLGSLGIALLMVLSLRFPTRLVKAAVIPLSIPVLLIFADLRKDHLRADLGERHYTGTGLESAASPLKTFATLLEKSDAGLLVQAWGQTFWATLVSFVPRPVWPDKPEGFGADLVRTTHPELVDTSHSDAALLQGEWLYNFGILGLVLMVPVVGFGIRFADRLVARATLGPLVNRWAVLACAAAIIVAACLPNLVWAGTFTFVVRTGLRLMVLVAVWFLFVGRTRGVKRHARPAAAPAPAADLP